VGATARESGHGPSLGNPALGKRRRKKLDFWGKEKSLKWRSIRTLRKEFSESYDSRSVR